MTDSSTKLSALSFQFSAELGEKTLYLLNDQQTKNRTRKTGLGGPGVRAQQTRVTQLVLSAEP
jgi:hypothetical protein